MSVLIVHLPQRSARLEDLTLAELRIAFCNLFAELERIKAERVRIDQATAWMGTVR